MFHIYLLDRVRHHWRKERSNDSRRSGHGSIRGRTRLQWRETCGRVWSWDIDGQLDSALVAAFYAAQGFVVVAPNYAGYAGSTLPYHPFVNALQQSADMM